MKGLLAFFFFCLALASATVVHTTRKTKVASHDFVEKQQKILQLFYHVYQPNPYEDQVAIGKAYDIKANIEHYNDSSVVEHFLSTYQSWMLPKGRTFSVFYGRQMNESVALFELFYYAKDFDTFYKTALWAREYINEEMFIYAFSAALLHRPDCKDFFIPALYEIFPQYFFTTETIQRAYNVKMQGNGKYMGPYVEHGERNLWYVYSNYSNWYYNYNWEQRLSYFTEDIGWNNYYYNYFLRFPYWMDGEKYGLVNENRGALFFFVHHQILARYYMERLSNGMGEIPEFSWDFPVEIGYDSYLKYPNGMNFPSRPNFFEVKKYAFFLEELEDYERRVRDAVARGFANKYDGTRVTLRTPESIEVISNLIEANIDSPNPDYYGYTQFLARSLMGNSPRPPTWHKVTPSTLEFYQTSLRDPMFYQLAKRYYAIFNKYQHYLPAYTGEELSAPGVKIESVDVSKLVTFFEEYDAEITNAVYQGTEEKIDAENHLGIFARQQRLNHKPFTVTTNIESDKATKVVFRFFLGPKYNGQHDVMTLDENRQNFFQLDQFVYELKSGKNVVERNSADFVFFHDDWTSSRKVWENIQHSLKDKTDYVIGKYAPFVSFPSRLALPKGAKGGMPFFLYVIATPYVAPTPVEGVEYPMIDHFTYGYPFDRPIYYEGFFHYTNMHFEDVMIFHKTEAEINKA